MTEEQATPPWRNPALPIADRVEALLTEMSLEEKVAQLGSRWVGNDMGDSGENQAHLSEDQHNVAPMQDVFAAGGGVPLEEAARHGLGHLTRVYGSVPLRPADGAAELIRQQRIVMAARLGIPAIVHEECLTGFTAFGATVYPAALAWGATFDPGLVERMATAIGRDMAALGVHQGLSPVLDVVRDYRWGRVEETMGEDPYLVATIASAYVRGLQDSGVIATLKHFAGYSASRGARNHGPVPMGRRELIDVILPPFEAAIRTGGAGSVMNSYADVDGVPAGADPWLLTEVLREEWGFTGTVVSDYWAVPFLATMHGVAADLADAGAQALSAGIDVELPDTIGYGTELTAKVRSGEVPQEHVDRAAHRVLTQKVKIGLLDPGWTPESSVTAAPATDLNPPVNQQLAVDLAERSIILLEPGTALPITDVSRIAAIGPCADEARTFLGCYAFPNHVLPRYPHLGLGLDVPTALDGLRSEFPAADISYAKGCDVRGDDRSGFAAAVEASRGANLTVAFVGDLAGLFGQGTSGEGCDAEDLRLPGVQTDLVEELLATGTPLVVVVVSGRPYALGALDGRLAGLVQAFMPGQAGGHAISGVLSGRVQPSGRLPVQIPRHEGGQPGTYLQPILGAEHSEVSNLDPRPLYPFGYGRSYTTFTVDKLRVSAETVPTDGEFTVTARVRNTGKRDGAEVVQLYLSDPVAQVTRPVRQLAGFHRIELAAGAGADVTFQLHADRTAFAGRDLRRVVEPGNLRVLVGTSAAGPHLQAIVRLTGPARTPGPGLHLTTPVEEVLPGVE